MTEIGPGTQQTTAPARRWFLKTLIVTLVLAGFGVWGLYDALVAYPNRGREVASYRLFEYLEAARHPTYGFDGAAGVPLDADPAEYARQIRERKTELEAQAAGIREDAARSAAADLALLNYLDALSVMFDLSSEKAYIENPDARFRELRQEWRGSDGEPKQVPKPLASYDIPVQWIFVLVGSVGGVWGTIFMIRVVSTKYHWDPETKRLTLPSGATLVPEDVAEFDKRKWDKFLIFLKIKESHETLGGQELKVDLYRHTPLEEWIIEMHRTAFPDDFAEEDAEAAAEAEGEEASERASVEAARSDSQEGADDVETRS